MSLTDDDRWMDLDEFRDGGYLQEINRCFLHPLGLALAIEVDDDSNVTGWFGVRDHRDDPEGIAFEELTEADHARATRLLHEWRSREPARREALGWMVQPAGESWAAEGDS